MGRTPLVERTPTIEEARQMIETGAEYHSRKAKEAWEKRVAASGTRLCPDCSSIVIFVLLVRCAACRKEKQRAYDKEYTRRPEVRVKEAAYMRAYQQRPENKARHRTQALASYRRLHSRPATKGQHG